MGLTLILKYATVLNVPREKLSACPLLGELFKCSLCLGFWSGFIIFLIGSSHYYLMPLASAGASWITDNFNQALQSIEAIMDEKIKSESKNAK